MMAILDAFMFLLIVSVISASLPIMEEASIEPRQLHLQMVRNAHAAIMKGNTTSLAGGGDMALWNYVELALAAGEKEKFGPIVELASARIAFLLPGCAWEWIVRLGDIRASHHTLAGDILCDEIVTVSGCCFRLRVSFSAGPS